MARREGPSAKTGASANGTALRAQYRATRARLMGREMRAPSAPPPPGGAVDATPSTWTKAGSGPESWLAELVAFNEALRRLFIGPSPHASRAGERIRAVVASHYGISLAEICGGSSARRCAWPRQVAMYICVREAALPTPLIAQLFGDRDPSTVLYAHRAVTVRAARDRALERDIAALTVRCRRGEPA